MNKTKTIYFLIDCSGSMHGPRGDAVNNAMQRVVAEAIPEIKRQKPEDLDISFMALGFSDNGTDNHVIELMPKTALDDFSQWDDIDPEMFHGGTPTDEAIQAVIDDMNGGTRGDPDLYKGTVAPAIILISDGLPNGTNPTYEEVLECGVKGTDRFQPIFRRALRVAIGINVDENGRESLKKFGSVSEKMKNAGIEGYYDCSENYVDRFVEILKSATINASVNNSNF